MIGDIWAMCKDYILVPPFEVPANWIITRAYDHGSSDPFCCLWFAKSNGEDLTFPGRENYAHPSRRSFHS